MEGRAERDSTITRSKQSILGLLSIALVLLASCEPDLQDDPIPFTTFPPVLINTNLPEYQSLKTQRYIVIDDIGVRGVILYKVDDFTYHAYDQNCSYRPNEACANVTVHTSGLYMEDVCCNSIFEFATGLPTSGPAWRPLRQYATSLSGAQLTITSEILN